MTRHYQRWEYKKPLEAKGGIKSHTTRGRAFASNWWSKRWTEILEECIDPGRLSRGRSYARRGQVLSIEIEPGLVSAQVQGTRKRPYEVRMGFQTASDKARELLIFRFREHASFAAHLLAGEMPKEMEQVFSEAGIPLFPNRSRIRLFKCTCPDDATPCKHIVAVLLLLAEVLDDDPFLLLKLRGLDRDRLITLLTAGAPDSIEDEYEEENETSASDANCETASDSAITGGEDEHDASSGAKPADGEKTEEWFGGEMPIFPCQECDGHAMPVALDIINEFPFWRGSRPFKVSLRAYYDRAANFAAELLTGEKRAAVGRPRKLI